MLNLIRNIFGSIIADIDSVIAPQVAGVVNTLLSQLRTAGILIS